MLMTLSFGTSYALEGFENVVFHLQNEITVTRAKWLVSFHIDLRQFDAALLNLQANLEEVRRRAEETDFKEEMNTNSPYGAAFMEIKEQLEELRSEKGRLVGRYNDFSSIGGRRKRSVLPFVGDALSYLFGVTSSADMRAVEKAVQRLKDTQKGTLHLIEDSITIINITRDEVGQNRHKINTLIGKLGGTLTYLNRTLIPLERNVNEMRESAHVYWHYNLLMNKLLNSFTDVRRALDFLEFQLNLLAKGQLTPSIISPHRLRILLEEIAKTLPEEFKLAREPGKDIWYYYRTLGCSTLFNEQSITIVAHIPLLDREHTYEVYRIFNFPLPLPTRHKSLETRKWTVRFQLETDTIAINKDRTRYVLLNEMETLQCVRRDNDLCKIESPIYLSNRRDSCELSLFKRDRERVRKNCISKVKTNTRLPWAVRIDEGTWILALEEEERFTVRCREQEPKELYAKAPLATIHIGRGCTAYSNAMILTAQIRGISEKKETQKLQIPQFNISQAIVWGPITKIRPNLMNVTLPKELSEMGSISPMRIVKELRKLEADKTTTWKISPLELGAFIAGAMLILMLIGITVWQTLRYQQKIKRNESRENGILEVIKNGFGFPRGNREEFQMQSENTMKTPSAPENPTEGYHGTNELKIGSTTTNVGGLPPPPPPNTILDWRHL